VLVESHIAYQAVQGFLGRGEPVRPFLYQEAALAGGADLPAEPIARFEEHHLGAPFDQLERSGETSEAPADHGYAHVDSSGRCAFGIVPLRMRESLIKPLDAVPRERDCHGFPIPTP
jgi:hypothetical protein